MIEGIRRIKLKVQRVGTSVQEGQMTYHFQGVQETNEGDRKCSQRFILSTFADQAPSRRELAELALIQVGDEVEFLVRGILKNDGHLYTSYVEAVTNITLASQ